MTIKICLQILFSNTISIATDALFLCFFSVYISFVLELYQVRNMSIVCHLFDIIELLIFPFVRDLSVLNFHWSSIVLLFLFFMDVSFTYLSGNLILSESCMWYCKLLLSGYFIISVWCVCVKKVL